MGKSWEEVKEMFDSIEVVKVIFTKKDGTIREMNCTRTMYMIPAEFHPKTNKEPNYKSMPVFDLDKQQWRSFNIDSIISIEPKI